MNASISEDSGKKVASAQVCKECGTTTLGTRYTVSGHGSGSKPGSAPGELRSPAAIKPHASDNKAGMRYQKVKQSK